jgi:hypothetical protein
LFKPTKENKVKRKKSNIEDTLLNLKAASNADFHKVGQIYTEAQLMLAHDVLSHAHDRLLSQVSFTDKFPYEDSVREAMSIIAGMYYQLGAEIRYSCC